MTTDSTLAATSQSNEHNALTEPDTDAYEVNDLRDSNHTGSEDWMTKLLLNKEFQIVPASNLHTIFSRLEPANYKADEVIFDQGEVGEFFYIITRGKCMVSRKLPKDRGSITLAELGVGDTFGEEALITDARRMASISMLTDGAVMKLSKTDFLELLSEPIVTFVDQEQADALIANGGMWLDVNFSSNQDTKEKKIMMNIPMSMLRHKLDSLNIKQHVVVTSSDNSHSCAAAHILRQHGFEVSVVLNQEAGAEQ